MRLLKGNESTGVHDPTRSRQVAAKLAFVLLFALFSACRVEKGTDESQSSKNCPSQGKPAQSTASQLTGKVIRPEFPEDIAFPTMNRPSMPPSMVPTIPPALAGQLRLTDPSTPQGIESLALETMGIQFKLTTAEGEVLRGICTGVLVGKNAVLTAAHCFAPPKTKPISEVSGFLVQAASFSEALGKQLVAIEKVAIHPEWNGVFHDLAVVFGKQAIADERRIVSILTDVEKTPLRSQLVLFGYGATGKNREDGGVLRRGESELHSFVNSANYPGSVIQNQFRVKGENDNAAGACGGDSGGPAFLKDNGKLVGLVSGMSTSVQGILDCEKKDINYTIIEKYLPWIEAMVSQNLTGKNEQRLIKDYPFLVMPSNASSAIGFTLKPAPLPVLSEAQPAKNMQRSEDAEAEVTGDCGVR